MAAAAFREYEVEVTLIVTAPDRLEAEAAVRRSGLSPYALIGEALVDKVTVWGSEDE